MRISLVVAAVATAILSIAPAAADAPPDRSFARQPVPSAVATPVRRAHVRHAHRPHARGHRHARFVAVGPVYGPEPAYYPGLGGASPNRGFGSGLPVTVTQYREAYIGRGLIYNTPPQPFWPGSETISVRY